MTNIDNSVVGKGAIKFYTFNIVLSITYASQQTILLDEGECKYVQQFQFFSAMLSKWLSSASLSSFQLMSSLLLAPAGSLKRLKGSGMCTFLYI